MAKRKNKETGFIAKNTAVLDEKVLYNRIIHIIESRQYRAVAHANQEVTLMFWEVGRRVNSEILDFKRATYGKKILSELATKLVKRYGRSFAERNLYRMM
jgi:hypothetical protein